MPPDVLAGSCRYERTCPSVRTLPSGFIAPCLPTKAGRWPPPGDGWAGKHDQHHT
jgi:hypothetical protein